LESFNGTGFPFDALLLFPFPGTLGRFESGFSASSMLFALLTAAFHLGADFEAFRPPPEPEDAMLILVLELILNRHPNPDRGDRDTDRELPGSENNNSNFNSKVHTHADIFVRIHAAS
jgi:hypothetical protein